MYIMSVSCLVTLFGSPPPPLVMQSYADAFQGGGHEGLVDQKWRTQRTALVEDVYGRMLR